MQIDPKDPSYLGALMYFHHAAKCLSFSQAANALNVTPSAVSHRISALETALGKRLFERRVRAIQLTQDGIELAHGISAIWEALQTVTGQVTRQDVLRVSVGPYLSSQWLLPQIGAFEAENPGVRIDLIHRIGEPTERLADVSIVWSKLSDFAVGDVKLFDSKSIPVAASGLQLEDEFWAGSAAPIHYRDRSAWRHWLKAAGAPASFADRGDVIDEPNLVLEAAAHGRGIAIGFLPFVVNFFETGRLMAISETSVASDRGYRLVINAPHNTQADVFARWIAGRALSLRNYPSSTSRDVV